MESGIQTQMMRPIGIESVRALRTFTGVTGAAMTLPYQRTNAVLWARDFLVSLMDPKKTPRVPRKLRVEARHILKHYPSGLDMERVIGDSTRVFNHPESTTWDQTNHAS